MLVMIMVNFGYNAGDIVCGDIGVWRVSSYDILVDIVM